jgi:hypothetical protein
LRIRPDNVGEDGGKYRWLSSGYKPGGIGSGVHCHVARPLLHDLKDTAIWISEGELKADLSAERLRAKILSVPGASCWAHALPDVVELLPAGGRVVVALDADWREKPQVRVAVWNLAQACLALGYAVEIALWDPMWKGLDDLLVAGHQPELHSLERIPEPAWELKLSSQILADAPIRPPVTAVELEMMRQALLGAFAEVSQCS